MFAVFQILGQHPVAKLSLNKSESGAHMETADSFTTRLLIRSGPDALLVMNFVNSLYASWEFVVIIQRVCGLIGGSVCLGETCGSIDCWTKYSLRSSAFSLFV